MQCKKQRQQIIQKKKRGWNKANWSTFRVWTHPLLKGVVDFVSFMYLARFFLCAYFCRAECIEEKNHGQKCQYITWWRMTLGRTWGLYVLPIQVHLNDEHPFQFFFHLNRLKCQHFSMWNEHVIAPSLHLGTSWKPCALIGSSRHLLTFSVMRKTSFMDSLGRDGSPKNRITSFCCHLCFSHPHLRPQWYLRPSRCQRN